MANNLNANPIVIDSTGSVITRKVKVRGILINPSADTFLVVLNNNRDGVAGAVENFRYTNQLTDSEQSVYIPFDGQEFDGIWATTLTDVTNVLVYLV